MNSRQIQNDETTRNQVINPFISANTSFPQGPIINNLNIFQNPSNINISKEKHEIIQEQITSKIIEPKNNEINSVPFKSLVKEEPSRIINPSANVNNVISSANVVNPFSNRFTGSTYKIELFKSPNQSSLMNKVQVITLNPSKKNQENYKLLIKRIAAQLRKKIHPPTKGFFYKCINQEKEQQYKILVKKIANQLKKRVKFPTSKILKIYESYIILIKRIALALKLSIEKRKNENQIIQEEKPKVDMNVNKIEPIENIEENKKIMREKSGSKSKKHLNFNIGIMTKEQINEEAGMKIFEEKKDKNELINNDDALETNQKNEIDMNEDIDVNLSNFEVNSVDFINDFKNFLDKVNISIVNNFPVSLNEKNKKYFNQNSFWFLLLNYIFYQSPNITIYAILSLIEQYFIWCQDITKENFLKIKELIKEYISKNLTNEKLNQILYMNKLKSIDDIFTRYDPYFIENKKNHFNYKEIKIDDLSFINNANAKCDCDLCKSDEACLKKVADINKEKIKIIKGQNLDFIGNKDINKPEVNMDIDNGEEIYFKGISNKKNKVFTESKTRLSENTNFVYTSINSVNNNIINKEDSDEKNKTYKNISKRKDKIDKVLEEKKSSEKKEDKEENEEKEEIEIVTKNKKKGRPKKDKSLNKRKKKDKSKDKKNEEENEEKEEEKEEKKEEDKTKKRKKSRTKKNKKSKKLDDSESKDNESEEDEKSLKNSRRKKSKTPRNKKSQNINEK